MVSGMKKVFSVIETVFFVVSTAASATENIFFDAGRI
jgi:hypothetical protein